MKIRLGFVPNSSSSSFVCEICGRSESGFDASAEMFDMIVCVNGHTICLSEMIEDPPFNENEENEENEENDGDLDEKYCPICQFIVFSNSDLSSYLLKLTGISSDEAFAEVKKLNPRRKKLYDPEYILYACSKGNINKDALMGSVKEKFKSYKEFAKFLSSKE